LSTAFPSHKTQLYLVRLLTDWTLREIAELFAGNGLTEKAGYDESKWPIGTSVRRSEAASYLAAVDPSDERQRVQLLRVFDDVLRGAEEDTAEELARLLAADGVSFQSPTSLRAQDLTLPEPTGRLGSSLPDFTEITDPAVLMEHAQRMQRASVAGDAADSVLAARELAESVCKLICEHFGVDIPKSPSLGQLYKLAAKPLRLDPAGLSDDEAPARKVLSGLVQAADGLGELRTRIGRGHGRTRPSAARQRHADLATGAASTLAIFLLDTWKVRMAEEDSP
jgi:hypothetical protein